MSIKKYDFFKTKYGDELLIDLIHLETLEKYIAEDCPHYLTYYDITLLTGGKGYFHIDQYQYSIQPGTILFSSPGQVRYWNIEVLPKGYVLIFEEEFLSRFLNDLQFINDLKYFNTGLNPPKFDLATADMQYVIKLMENIEQEIETFSQNDKYILQALLYQILVWLNRKYSATYQTVNTENYNRYISQYSKLVNKEFKDHHSVSYYAENLNITSGHLNDLCKLHLGINAKQYIQNRIILEAKRLLLYTDMQIEEIASQLSFEETSYFIRKFKQITGITPLSFRQTKNP
jgi:AraC family transcriptional regulator, transcriptional activator of pobA